MEIGELGMGYREWKPHQKRVLKAWVGCDLLEKKREQVAKGALAYCYSHALIQLNVNESDVK